MSQVVIDVRERDEYELEHIEHSINVPLSAFSSVVPGVLNQLKDRKIIFMCRSGARAQQACEQAKGLGFNDDHTFDIYEGGIVKWVNKGNPVLKKTGKTPLPLMRQMQIIMGIMFMIFSTLGTFFSPWFSSITIIFGAGLFMAGMTGDCAVAGLLAKAPWNKADSSLKANYCRASSGDCQL